MRAMRTTTTPTKKTTRTADTIMVTTVGTNMAHTITVGTVPANTNSMAGMGTAHTTMVTTHTTTVITATASSGRT